MENTKKSLTEPKTSKEEYNAIPVHYCTNCKSLKIMNYSNNISYCDDCGSTEISSTTIDKYLESKKQTSNGNSTKRS